MSHPRRTIPWLMAATMATGVGIAAAQPATAAAGCRVDYTVTNQWPAASAPTSRSPTSATPSPAGP